MKRSLNGLRILNTRPQEQAHKLTESIRASGGIAIELPALEIQASNSDWVDLLPNLDNVTHAIFISANAVHYCFTQLNQLQINWPTSIQVIAIGQGTASSLQKFNIQVSAIPEFPNSEHLLSLDTLQHLENQNVLLFKGKEGRPLIEEQLMQKGAKLVILKVYQRVMPKPSPLLVQSIWRDDLVDIILLTSEQSLLNLFKIFDKEAHDWLKSKRWLVISERIAQIASSLGIHKINIIHPNQVLNTLFDYVNKD
ncbi:uroporphyrinogen-III synthase [Legionella longbeachae]|uniref:Uroporphyrinogen-III synthase n=1 Tax=Legionella longbeachae serogroup 1 (strain NSW150) TaxID=661367 RepID=D3HP39_LEGLN|nr:uroporphyrinogen-III synthase [Legionella longbeachae]VEE01180.1 uroporphyrinogen-III synthase [Legionella oakridgensis]HBD7398381.1 uroporphyrinogen-III synthase [Legionella pneumophila]ARB92448.1 uroporphyrinogen-III synthase [Legionella longbeachae]ARM34372.1 uroporphyrinogen-III synthase [Legionella longbeachae]EEZ96346.1 uroporphyrinogen-III synthase [Legionella longbeachae D-4968]